MKEFNQKISKNLLIRKSYGFFESVFLSSFGWRALVSISLVYLLQCSGAFVGSSDEILEASKKEVLVYKGELGSVGFRLKESLLDKQTASLAANLACDGMSESAKLSQIKINKNETTWGSNNWSSWSEFAFQASNVQFKESELRCKLMVQTLQSTNPSVDGYSLEAIPITFLASVGGVDTLLGIIVSPGLVSLTEGGRSAYTIRLNRKPSSSSSPVAIRILSDHTALSVYPSELEFSRGDWNVEKRVVINVADNDFRGDYSGYVSHYISDAAEEDESLSADGVMVNILDNDSGAVDENGALIDDGAGRLIFSKSELSFNEDEEKEYTIHLSHQPAPGKQVRLSLDSMNSEMVITPSDIIFTRSNFNTPRRIVVSHSLLTDTLVTSITHDVLTDESTDDISFYNSAVSIDIAIVAVVDKDGNGLIEIYNASMLNNIRYNLEGTSYQTSSLGSGNTQGCPAGGCVGYELARNIDLLHSLDRNGNGRIDTKEITIDKNSDGDTDDAGESVTVIDTDQDDSWVPIGALTQGVRPWGSFTGLFDGNQYEIQNLWVNIDSADSGLFWSLGHRSRRVDVKNLIIRSGSLRSTGCSGGLASSSGENVNINNVHVYASVSAFSLSQNEWAIVGAGGIVGCVRPSFSRRSPSRLYMHNVSYGKELFSSGDTHSRAVVTAVGFGGASAGGLVGASDGHIEYSSSRTLVDGVFAHSSNGSAYAGGIVGKSSYNVVAELIKIHTVEGIFSDGVFGSYAGGFVGFFKGLRGEDGSFVRSSINSRRNMLKIESTGFSGSVSAFGLFGAYSGGLVGYLSGGAQTPEAGDGRIEIYRTKVYLKGYGVSSYAPLASRFHYYSGGMIGYFDGRPSAGLGAGDIKGTDLSIVDSWVGGEGNISSHASQSSRVSESNAFSGGLVGYFDGTGVRGRPGGKLEIMMVNVDGLHVFASSTFSGRSKAFSGGLVGYFSGTGYEDNGGGLSIRKSNFSGKRGGVFAGSTSLSSAGGLVGYYDGMDEIRGEDSYNFGSTLDVRESAFSGGGGVSASSPFKSFSGGLVGYADGDVIFYTDAVWGRGDILAGYLTPVATLNTEYPIESQYPVDSFSGGLIGYFGSRSLSLPAGKVLFNLTEETNRYNSLNGDDNKVSKQWRADRTYALTNALGDLIHEIKIDPGEAGIDGVLIFGEHGFMRGNEETHNMGIPHDFWLGNNPTFTEVISEIDRTDLKVGGLLTSRIQVEKKIKSVLPSFERSYYAKVIEQYKKLGTDGNGLDSYGSRGLVRSYHDYLRGGFYAKVPDVLLPTEEAKDLRRIAYNRRATNDLLITNSYFSTAKKAIRHSGESEKESKKESEEKIEGEGKIYSENVAGGLVGMSQGDAMITNSYVYSLSEISARPTLVSKNIRSYRETERSDSFESALSAFASRLVDNETKWLAAANFKLVSGCQGGGGGDDYNPANYCQIPWYHEVLQNVKSPQGLDFLNSPVLGIAGGIIGAHEGYFLLQNSYFAGDALISANNIVGGIVGWSGNAFEMQQSYFGGGGVFAVKEVGHNGNKDASYAGAIWGASRMMNITIDASYWSGDGSVSINGAEGEELLIGGSHEELHASRSINDTYQTTIAGLKSLNGSAAPLELFHGPGDAWDLATENQLPTLRRCISADLRCQLSWAFAYHSNRQETWDRRLFESVRLAKERDITQNETNAGFYWYSWNEADRLYEEAQKVYRTHYAHNMRHASLSENVAYIDLMLDYIPTFWKFRGSRDSHGNLVENEDGVSSVGADYINRKLIGKRISSLPSSKLAVSVLKSPVDYDNERDFKKDNEKLLLNIRWYVFQKLGGKNAMGRHYIDVAAANMAYAANDRVSKWKASNQNRKFRDYSYEEYWLSGQGTVSHKIRGASEFVKGGSSQLISERSDLVGVGHEVEEETLLSQVEDFFSR